MTNTYLIHNTVDDYVTFEEGVKALLDSAGRALGAVLNKVKLCGNLGYKIYTQLHINHVSVQF